MPLSGRDAANPADQLRREMRAARALHTAAARAVSAVRSEMDTYVMPRSVRGVSPGPLQSVDPDWISNEIAEQSVRAERCFTRYREARAAADGVTRNANSRGAARGAVDAWMRAKAILHPFIEPGSQADFDLAKQRVSADLDHEMSLMEIDAAPYQPLVKLADARDAGADAEEQFRIGAKRHTIRTVFPELRAKVDSARSPRDVTSEHGALARVRVGLASASSHLETVIADMGKTDLAVAMSLNHSESAADLAAWREYGEALKIAWSQYRESEDGQELADQLSAAGPSTHEFVTAVLAHCDKSLARSQAGLAG